MKALAVLTSLVAVAAVPALGQSRSDSNCTVSDLPKTWEGKAFAVSGDTLAGSGLNRPIHLWGIRAPEGEFGPNGFPGMRARAALADMLLSGEHQVSCRMVGKLDGRCQPLAQCTITAAWPNGSVPQPHDLALRLVEDGYAIGVGLEAPPAWDKDAGEKIAHFEALSRQARKGLWPDWLGEQPKAPTP
jgi:endonuclease YncB( thermonuclease family)